LTAIARCAFQLVAVNILKELRYMAQASRNFLSHVIP